MDARMQALVQVPSDSVLLEGSLEGPEVASGIVLFAHGSGSSRHSPRNQYVAEVLRGSGFATLLLDLLTMEEDSDVEKRFDIALLANRLGDALTFIQSEPGYRALPVGLFGASTGAAAALRVAAAHPDLIEAVVSRGGRPDLAGEQALASVQAPTLLIVGGGDWQVLSLNRAAMVRLAGEASLVVVPGATHLFEETGALEAVARHASSWFTRHLLRACVPPPSG